MSKKNILSKTNIGNTTHVVFQTDQGNMTYEYKGSSARALKNGRDPSQLSGKLIRHDKREK